MATHQKKYTKKRHTVKELLFCSPDEDETYGQIIAAKGDTRFEIRLIKNNATVIGKIRGSLIKGPNKKRINKDDFVLLQKDLSSDNDKYFIIHKYSPDDIKKLKKSGELTSIINVNENNEDYNDNDNDSVHVLFDDDVLSKVDEIEINDDFIASI